MMLLRRSALRIVSSPSVSLISKSRTITSFAPSPLRITQKPTSIQFQRRWATGEAEAKKEEDAPISQLQPTPQQEVENAIHSDNAADGPEGQAQVLVESNHSGTANDAGAAEESFSEQTSFDGESSRYRSRSSEGDRPQRTEVPEEVKALRATPKPTIYIGNLFFDVTENDLVKELSRFGEVVKCRLMRDSRGLSKGFGYVDFASTEAATSAIQTLNQQLFEGRRLAVQYAAYETKTLDSRKQSDTGRPSKPLNPPSKTLFIGNMSFEMTDRDLNNLFRGIRNVIDVRVAIDRRTGQPRGFAHADFIDVKSAVEAMKTLQDKETYGRRLRVDYSYGPSNAPRNQQPE